MEAAPAEAEADQGPERLRRQENTAAPVRFSPGMNLLLRLIDRNFMVEVLDVSEDRIRVSFPGIDYPAEGMPVEIELHDATGFTYFQTRVLAGPRPEGDGIDLERPTSTARSMHRESCRVPTDLAVELRHDDPPVVVPGRIRNISTGGALVESAQKFLPGVDLAARITLPEGVTVNVRTQVLHAALARNNVSGPVYAYGTRFIGYEPGAGRVLTEYVWQRLKDLYPSV